VSPEGRLPSPRVVVIVPLIAVATLVLGGPALVLGLLDRSGRWPHLVARSWARLVLRACGVRVVVEGRENVPTCAAVFAANHASALDIPILFGHLPAPFRIIYKKSLTLLPLVGWYLFLSGHISIDRGNPFRARKSLAAAARRIRNGASVAVFPEGTRVSSPAPGIFKRGTFLLAIDAGAPVVPVSLVGVKSVVPSGISTLRPGTVAIRIHPPVATSRDPDEAEALAAEVRGIVLRGCEAPAC
jgi:1-acyl-sn-glycerol-3-phosphate acyltransferase